MRSTRKSSPFNYRKNGLLYISENVPFPDRRDENYINALADEVEKLILASYGHTAVLFTSYNTMGCIFTMVKNRSIPFPMFRLGKGDIRELERFKQSGNGVLFASGAMWEGLDVPGDALSTVILTKLPFSAPDPISEYERKQYSGMSEYKDRVLTRV